MGFELEVEKVTASLLLAKESQYVDLILGGHTHTFLDAPELHKNKAGSDVLINQVGWAGIVLGRLDFEFKGTKNKNLVKSHAVAIREKATE